jgi:hypothetical protein
MLFPLSIGILSWGQQTTLRNTLDSYKRNGLLEKATQSFIFFQEISDEDIEIAEEYRINAIGIKENIGIAGGYKRMLEEVSEPYFLFLENDWVQIVDTNRGKSLALEEGYTLLTTGMADVIRYRSRFNPGHPLWSRQFAGNEMSRPEYLLDSVHWDLAPEKSFPNEIARISEDWYATTSAYANWTNNPHMVRTEWAREVLVPRLEGDIEKSLQQQEYIVAQGEGLFTHGRIG